MFLVLLALIFVLLPAGVLLWRRHGKDEKRVTIVVLGDIGRSPRMQYHSCSLAKKGFLVDIIGYGGSVPHADVSGNANIALHFMQGPPAFFSNLPRLLMYAVKVIWQVLSLFITMVTVKKPSHVLLQNPPALPSMLVCWLVCRLQGSQFVIDWHNYGYTILALNLHRNHPLVKFSKVYERFFGRLSDKNLCVTNAMREDLSENWGIRATTMYDRPPLIFKEASLEARHQLTMKLAKPYPIFGASGVESDDEMTAFTGKSSSGSVYLRPDRPALLISSTSWTEDEDFSVLLNALEKYETVASHDTTLRDIVCVITGKGPLKAHYMSVIASKQWKHVQVCTPWLEAEDYPVMLGCADLGVCLHMSSSGLDLPMKVVDMFGCGLPVCAIHFKCLSELVVHEQNGLVFSTEEELAQQLQDMLAGFPDDCKKLETFRKNLRTFQKTRWTETWTENVGPIFEDR